MPLSTSALQANIDAVWRRGGGEVRIGPGEHHLGPVRLRSGIRLRLQAGAHVYGSDDCEDYVDALARDGVEPVAAEDLRRVSREDLSKRSQYALFLAFRAHDIEIVGEEGSFVNGVNCPDKRGQEGYRGPHTFWFACSTNITIRGVRVSESANCAYRFVDCEQVLLKDVSAEGGHDGVHFDLCSRVRILGSVFHTGDDSVAGSGCTDIVVSNCVLSSACSPFRLGGRDVLVANCRVTGPAKHPHRWTLTQEEKQRGAPTAEVSGRRTVGAFFQGYTGDVAQEGFVPGNMTVRNTTVENAERFFLSVSGLPGALWQEGNGIVDITFDNVRATGLAVPAAVVAKADSPMTITLRNCSFAFRTPQSAAFFGKHVRVVDEGVRLENAERIYDERPNVSYDDVPEFPSWRIESDTQRRKWRLPPLKPQMLTVSPDGLTPQAAIDRIRAARKDGDRRTWEIRIRGVNELSEPLHLTDDDHDLVFVGEGDAALSGGVAVKGWRDVGDGVWEADAPRMADGRTMFFDQLWANGRRAACARLPSEGWLSIVAASQTVARVEAGVTNYLEHVAFSNEVAKVLAKVPQEDLPYLEAGVICNWSYGLRTLASCDAVSDTVTFETSVRWPRWMVWRPGNTLVAFFNVRSSFDAPGEWFLDMKAGKLRYRPLPGETPTTFSCIVPRPGMSRLVDFRGEWRKGRTARRIMFRNLAFRHTSTVADGNRPVELVMLQAASCMDGAVTAEGVREVSFENCRVEHTANYAMRFNSSCVSNRIVGCTLEDVGAGGVWMGADNAFTKKKKSEIPRKVLAPVRPDAVAFNLISNCTIRTLGRYNPEGTGVALTHCSDTKVVHCDISDVYYTGVSVGFTWSFSGSVAQRNEIAYNRIWDLGKGVMSDMGGVYTLGTSFGTTVHDNVIHDVWSFNYGGWGLYCDEGSEGIVMERNLVWNTTDGGFHQHYGTGCTIRNNIFAFNRMTGAVRMNRDVVDGIPCTLNFVNNIVYVKEGPLCGKGVRKVGGVWANNLWYSTDGKGVLDALDWAGWAASGKEVCGRMADPLFVDAENFDFRLKPESPAFGMGFKAWDYAAAGRRN